MLASKAAARVAPSPHSVGNDIIKAEKAIKRTINREKSTDGSLDVEEVWLEFEKGDRKFFSSICMATDGGYSEVSTLFRPERFIWASVGIGCLVMNLFFIIQPNVAVLIQADSFIVEVDNSSRYLLANFVAGSLVTGNKRFEPKILLAGLELFLLAYHVMRTAWLLVKCLTFKSKVKKWHGMANLMWDVFPDLCSFSAMRSLHYVTPKIFVPHLTRHVRLALDPEVRGTWRSLLIIPWLGKMGLHGLIGLEAFMIKFIIASEQHASATSFLRALIVATAFLNQMLGVIDVHKFAQRRLFTFIFGGEDSYVSRFEMKVATTWMAMLARSMWKESKGYRPRVLWFLAVGLSYGDSDFQQLVLNDHFKRDKARKDLEAPFAEDVPVTSLSGKAEDIRSFSPRPESA